MKLKFVTALLLAPVLAHADAYESLLRRYERQITQQSRQLKALKVRRAQNESEAARCQKQAEAAQARWNAIAKKADSVRSLADQKRESWVVTRNLAESVEWEAVTQQLVAQSARQQVEALSRELYARARIDSRDPALTAKDRTPEYLSQGLQALGQKAVSEAESALGEQVRLRHQELQLKSEEERQRQAWSRLRQEQQTHYAKWQRSLRQKNALEEENQQMEQSAQALQVMLENLRSDKDRAIAMRQEERTGAADPALAALKGTLPWPAPGEIVQNFGRQQSGELQQLLISNGIKIRAGEGKTVRAVQPGKVIFAAPFRRYGRMVIVQHAGGLASVYAGLESSTVEEGSRVAALDALGALGASGTFYFELRRDERPVNPMVYLTPERTQTITSRRTYR